MSYRSPRPPGAVRAQCWSASQQGWRFAATLSEDAPITKSALAWITVGLCLALAILCFLSHWDSNRGRRGKTIEVVDESSE